MKQKMKKHSGLYTWRVVNHTDAVVKRARVMGKNHRARGIHGDDVSRGSVEISVRCFCVALQGDGCAFPDGRTSMKRCCGGWSIDCCKRDGRQGREASGNKSVWLIAKNGTGERHEARGKGAKSEKEGVRSEQKAKL